MRTFSEVNSDSGKYLRHRHNFSLATINAGSIHVVSVFSSRVYDCASVSKNNGQGVAIVIPMFANKAYSHLAKFESNSFVDDIFQFCLIQKQLNQSSVYLILLVRCLTKEKKYKISLPLSKKTLASLTTAFIMI
ncbi:hypothetical protein Btru_056208 [Bulinus truncatus]|nr:hypothetical protein Btru_056208 [Bulinus truncatus]